MRQVERKVMLSVIDQRWREHLEEMDYLKEGINLRAMGQKDPLTEWQREGYEMFGAMMKGIAQDFVRYVMHVQVVPQHEQPQVAASSAASAPAASAAGAGARRAAVQNLQTTSSDTEQASAFEAAAAGADAAAMVRSATAIPQRRWSRPPGQPPGGQAGDRRQGRVVEDRPQPALPVRFGQEVQELPRRRLSARRCATSPTTSASCAGGSARPRCTCESARRATG